MIKILANDGIHPDGKLLLEEAGYQVDTQKVPQEKLLTMLPGYDIIIVRSATKVRKELIDACPNLKIIARGGVGLDNIDAEYAREKGIQVFNTPKAPSRAVAELVFGHMLSLVRMLNQSNRALSKDDPDFAKLKKAYSTGIQLKDKTLGIVGFGRIGQEVAKIAIAMGMKVLAADLVVSEAELDINVFKSQDVSLTVRLDTSSWEEVLRKSNFITLHVPSGSKPLIGAAEFEKMKDGVYIINTARGGTIDEDALLAALESGKVAGAGLDVFVGEPSPKKELLQHPLISVSPHIGGSTQEAQSAIGMELAEQIMEFLGA
ncbi:MAG: 3-phosphoglycerate dehydrogenase [Saprospiraceae bacterium]|nr:MAG: 3-phosphoglycerate dehydrogenase [Saprospiraceae bacterium]